MLLDNQGGCRCLLTIVRDVQLCLLNFQDSSILIANCCLNLVPKGILQVCRDLKAIFNLNNFFLGDFWGGKKKIV